MSLRAEENENCFDVLIVGAGPSGLMAARILLNHGRNIVVLEARNRVGGRAFSYPLTVEGSTKFTDVSSASIPKDATNETRADLGCSSIHGVQDSGNSMWNLALHHNIIIPKVMGGVIEAATNYENTLVAPWFHGGARIPQYNIVRMHRLHDAVVARMGSNATQRAESNVINSQLAKLYQDKTKDVIDTLQVKVSSLDNRVLRKIRNRYFGYCAPLEEQSPHDLRDSNFNFDEQTQFDEDEMRAHAIAIDKFLVSGKVHELIPVISGTEPEKLGTDVAPAHGYGVLVERVLGKNIPVLFKKIVRQVSAVTSTTTEMLEVLCQDGKKYRAKNVICTVPLGVLKSGNPLSSISFLPQLSSEKQSLVNNFKMGRHDKVVFRFAEKDVFWPKHVLQFNCLHSAVQFTNLHAVGKPGMLLAHIFGADKNFDISLLSDKEVVQSILQVLENGLFNKQKGYGNTILPRTTFIDESERSHVMKNNKKRKKREEVRMNNIPEPISTIVTRWENDPFACGSYSYCPMKTNLDSIAGWETPEKLGTDNCALYFAGEHTVDGADGWQCAHGASNSGVRVAYQIITDNTSRVDIESILEKVTYLPNPPSVLQQNYSIILKSHERTRVELHGLKSKVTEIERSFVELKKENEVLKIAQQKYSEQHDALSEKVRILSKLVEQAATRSSSSHERTCPKSNVVPKSNTNDALTVSTQSRQDEHSSISPDAIEVVEKNSDDPTWYLLKTPLISGKRQRAQCMHENKRKVTSTVCNRCRKFVCIAHWKDRSHFQNDSCLPYDSPTRKKAKIQGGRPGATYRGPVP